MAIYEISSDKFRRIDETSFSDAGLRERQDLQRLLRSQIEIVSPDTLIISEEFSQWDDSNRRIDLLGIDKDANLVVIELKRTEDGGHMELQSIRYAAMISAMTFERAVEVYAEYLERIVSSEVARTSLLEFLDWEEPERDAIFTVVRALTNAGHSPDAISAAVPWRQSMFRVADGNLSVDEFVTDQQTVAANGGRVFDDRRYFCMDGELIHFNGKTYAFRKRWGPHTIRAIDNLIAAFPDVKISYRALE